MDAGRLGESNTTSSGVVGVTAVSATGESLLAGGDKLVGPQQTVVVPESHHQEPPGRGHHAGS